MITAAEIIDKSERFIGYLFSTVLGLSLLSYQTTAAELEWRDISIEALLNLEVTTISKKAETLSNSPGIISSVNMSLMRSIGINSLKDALSMLPGILINKSHPGQTQVMIRGLSETFNQKVLFLLDGAPYWMSSHADIPLLGMPLSMIESVEVIRGPGAVIYGTNATAGVINVILKKDIEESEVTAFAGSFATAGLGGHRIKTFDQGYFSLGGALQKMNSGYEVYWQDSLLLGNRNNADGFVTGRDRQTGIETVSYWPFSGSQHHKEEYVNVIASGRYKRFSGTLHFFQSLEQGLGGLVTVWEKTQYDKEGYLLELKTSGPVNSGFSYEAYWRHNVMYLDFTISNFLDGIQRQVLIDENNQVSEQGTPFIIQEMATGKQSYQDPYQNNYRSTWGGNLSYQLNDDMLLFVGAEYESRSVGEYQRTDIRGNFDALQAPATKITEKSAFAQLDWTVNDYRLVLGGRFVDNELTGDAISPRLSAIYNLDEQSSIKLLYSEGFNSPTLSQVNLNINDFIFGNKNLKAETVETLDLAYTRASPRQIITVNAYHTHADNFIARVFKNPVPGLKDGPGIQLSNTGSFSRSGLEIDYQQVWESFTVLANFAYNREGNTTDKKDLLANGVPRYTMNLGLNWQLNEQSSLGLSLRYWSERGGDSLPRLIADNNVGSGTAPENFTLSPEIITNISYQHRFDSALMTLSVSNVFDESIYHPDHSTGGQNGVPFRVSSIPWGAGRSWLLSLTWPM